MVPSWRPALPQLLTLACRRRRWRPPAPTTLWSIPRAPRPEALPEAGAFTPARARAGIAEKNGVNVTDSGFVFGWDSSGSLQLQMEKSQANMIVSTAAGAVTTGQWMQVAFTWDGTVGTAAAAHIFVNGTEQAKASSADGTGLLGYVHATGR